MAEAFIIDAVRTPVGRRGGAGGAIHADDADEHFDLLWRVCVSGVWYGCRSALVAMAEIVTEERARLSAT